MIIYFISHKIIMAELCLGTVQFGMKYGINNLLGKPTIEESMQILEQAVNSGICIFDTARAYGTAEIVLGNYIQQRGKYNDLKIISKLRPNIIEPEEKDVYSVIRKEFEDSLQRLHIDNLDGYLLHTPQYVNNPEILSALVKLKEEKMTNNIGVSIYEIEDGFSAIRTGLIDYIQLPYSILDQRGVKEKFISEAKNAGVTIFARSVFLQGLFFMVKEQIPQYLSEAIPYIEMFEDILKKYKLDKVSALMKFVDFEKNIDYLVFGVDTKEQLNEDIDKFNKMKIPKGFIDEIKTQINLIDKSIILPSLWSNGKKAE